jgi:hypothetical protein
MSVTIVTHADFIEHPDDVRSESGPRPSLTLREGTKNLPLKIRGIEGVMSVTLVTPADFIEHPDDVRSESGP